MLLFNVLRLLRRMKYYIIGKKNGIPNLLTGGKSLQEKAEVTRRLWNSCCNHRNYWWRQPCVDRLTTRGSKYIFNAVNLLLCCSCGVLLSPTINTIGLSVTAGPKQKQKLFTSRDRGLISGRWLLQLYVYTSGLNGLAKTTTVYSLKYEYKEQIWKCW